MRVVFQQLADYIDRITAQIACTNLALKAWASLRTSPTAAADKDHFIPGPNTIAPLKWRNVRDVLLHFTPCVGAVNCGHRPIGCSNTQRDIYTSRREPFLFFLDNANGVLGDTGFAMKTWGVVVLVLAMSGCANMTEQQKNAAIGAGIGATAGAVMTKGSVLGAATGAVLGGIIGNETRR